MQVTTAQRENFAGFGVWWVDNKGHTQYAEFRPVTFYTKAQLETRNADGEETEFDCSSSLDETAFATDLDDPSGPAYNFNGFGNTQTQYEFLPHLPNVGSCLLGDPIMFDPPPESFAHICYVLKPDPDGNPTVFNMGGPGDPSIKTFLEEAAGHPGQAVTAMSIGNLSKTAPPPPPPPDPYHYQWFDNTRIWLPKGLRPNTTGVNSEANVCRIATEHIAHPAEYKNQLIDTELPNLKYCHTRAINNKKKPGKHPNIDWRITQIQDRVDHIDRLFKLS
jgi:hypothetical protein